MATAYPELILQDAAATTGNGNSIGFAEQMRFGTDYTNGLKPNQDRNPTKFKVRMQLKDTVAGTATATVIVEESNDNSSFTTLASITLLNTTAALSTGKARLFSTKKRYIRARVSAISGGTSPVLNAYAILGGGGI